MSILECSPWNHNFPNLCSLVKCSVSRVFASESKLNISFHLKSSFRFSNVRLGVGSLLCLSVYPHHHFSVSWVFALDSVFYECFTSCLKFLLLGCPPRNQMFNNSFPYFQVTEILSRRRGFKPEAPSLLEVEVSNQRRPLRGHQTPTKEVLQSTIAQLRTCPLKQRAQLNVALAGVYSFFVKCFDATRLQAGRRICN